MAPRAVLLVLAAGCAVLGAAEFSPSLDSDFTFTLPAGRRECFYQPMRKEASLELEYQVLDGAGLDVDFHLLSPKGETLVFDERKSDGVHTVETEDGDYMFCFDNTFSTISEKVIFFELILDNMGEEGQDQEDWKKYVTGTDLLDMKLEDILVHPCWCSDDIWKSNSEPSLGLLSMVLLLKYMERSRCYMLLVWQRYCTLCPKAPSNCRQHFTETPRK
ncbi:transmembrane emp24 domain-containing protein 5 isoform X2 [Cygnus olor]|uniref:transmembrane emp24 domain-containing protein 5 isoform X2 n=1 Tax=Cygnus olor TaxID=8869 RepID=UPI001ADE8854|nr:transmembrane emp24 domain-containing protein 5 isoform X2 [Cygnus olor]